jgi:outer membrane beta-barrel protein
MRKLIAGFILVLAAITSHSQKGSIKGTVTDSVEKKNLANAVIAILKNSDSVLVKFARANKDGEFVISDLDTGRFILMATHPFFGDYFDQIELKQNTPTELGNIYLTPKSKLLAEVIVKTGSPIRIKGDTISYTADSFKVRPGANVEELLRRLPGIQVDRNGQITAMGERVKKVLVDGEEFFGSDPGIATKNLRADQVQEVQVFDKKSDQAEFTGIDDGVKDKTINLKMKKLGGYFGKVEAGGGLPDKYNLDAMANSFQGKRKIAGYGVMSNTGQVNLDWQDAQNYGGGMDGISSGITDDGGMYISFNGGDDDYRGGRNGIPTNWNAGLHYSNKFDKDKLSLNSGYKFSKINATGLTTVFSNTFLPDTNWIMSSASHNFSSVNKHAFNVTLEDNLDSANSLKWVSSFNHNSTESRVDYSAQTLSTSGQPINKTARATTNNSDKDNITSNLLWRHKFKKLSRTLSVNTDFSWTQIKNDGLLYSLIDYYKNGLLEQRDTTDQQNIQDNSTRTVNTKIAYTEPIRKDVFVEVDYAIGYYNNNNDRITNEKSISGKYENIIDSLSNSYVFNRLVNTPGASFKVNKKKYNITFGASVGFSHFVEKNVTDNQKINYNYTNFYPKVSYTYKFKPNESFRFNYNGSTTAPSIEQLQPIRVNTDPLNIYIGNPGLNQSFRHDFNMGYNFYNVLKEKNLWSDLDVSFTQNAFVQYSIVDDFGKRTYQTVNANGIYNVNLWSQYGFKIKKIKLGTTLGPIVNVSRYIDYINTVKNITNTSSYGLRVNFDKYVEKKFNFYIGPRFTWNHSHASVNSAANADYWQFDGWAEGRVTLPKNFEFSTDANYHAREKDPRFTTKNNYTTWNASLIKRMLKDNKLELKLGVYDILDQNKGYQRNFNSYSFTETYYLTLRRFWLFTVTWNIAKNGKPATW